MIERLLLRRLPGDALGQVLVTLGLSFIAADFCMMVWGGDPINVETPAGLGGFMRLGAAGCSRTTGSPSSSSPWLSRSRSGC